MLKRSSKVYYRYRGRAYSVKALYLRLLNSRRPQMKDYQYSCIVEADYQGQCFPVKLVFVAKKGFKNQYLVLASTSTQLTPQEIIQLYSRRWSIETYFKAAKQDLRLNASLPEIKFIEVLVYLLKPLQIQATDFPDHTIDQFIVTYRKIFKRCLE